MKRSNGIVHNPVKQSVACDVIPPLTKGAQLIDQIVQLVINVCNHPNDLSHLERLADTRKSLEKYMTELEKETGHYHEHVRNTGGRPNSRGWSVSKSRHGNWRIQLTSLRDGRPCQVEGVFETREGAEQAAKHMIVELRKNVA